MRCVCGLSTMNIKSQALGNYKDKIVSHKPKIPRKSFIRRYILAYRCEEKSIHIVTLFFFLLIKIEMSTRAYTLKTRQSVLCVETL